MSSICWTFFLLLETLNFSDISVPSFNQTWLGIHAYNLTCTQVQLSQVAANWTANAADVSLSGEGRLHCYTNLTAYAYTGHLHATVSVHPADISIARAALPPSPASGSACRTIASTAEACDVATVVDRLYAEPPNSFLSLLLPSVRAMINKKIRPYVCDQLVPRFQAEITNITLPDRDPARPLLPGATPLSSSPLFVTLQSFTAAIAQLTPNSTWPEVHIGWRNDTVMAVDIYQTTDYPLSVDFLGSFIAASPELSWMEWIKQIIRARNAGKLPDPLPLFDLPGSLTNLSVKTALPELMSCYVELHVKGLQCEGFACSVEMENGLSIRSLRIENENGLGPFLSRTVAPPVEQMVNDKLNQLLQRLPLSSGSGEPKRVILPMREEAIVFSSVPWTVVVPMATVGLLLTVVLLVRNVRLYQQHLIADLGTSASSSTFQLAMKDLLLLLWALLCALGFVASNLTTGASVAIANNYTIYSFSLSNTVSDLWRSGLKPLAVCVLFFSGIYPYFKLLAIVYYTVLRHAPQSRVLKILDAFGKYSLIDTFALMIMVSGLQVQYLVKVRLLPSFYLFVAATLASIALGYYATNLWRRGVAAGPPCRGGGGGEPAAPVYTEVATEEPAVVEEAETVAPPASHFRRGLLRHLRLPGVVVVLCSVAAWVLPCISYTIGGAAQLLLSSTQDLTLSQLSRLSFERNVLLQGLAAVTILICPSLYVLLYPVSAALSSWCAADVFLMACVAGLLQLPQYIAFVMGGDMEEFYTASACLLAPLAGLSVAAVVVWVYLLHDLFPEYFPAKVARLLA